ncbi:hypothetical protein Tco_1281351 [Tanacetum coccineum]
MVGLRTLCTGSTQTYISYGVEFEVEPQEHRGFEVGHLGSCDRGDGSQVFQTQDLIADEFSHDREQCSVREPLRCRGDMVALGVVADLQ